MKMTEAKADNGNGAVELEINKCVIHRWHEATNEGAEFYCDYWDCAHKIGHMEKYYAELYPGGHVMCYCLLCAAFFMAQALNVLIDEKVKK